MALSERVLQIVVKAKDDASKTLSKMGGNLDKFSRGATTAGTAMTGAGVVIAMQLKKAADAAKEDEVATAKLEQAVLKAGDAYATFAPKIEDVNRKSIALGFTDDASTEALAKLTTMTGSTERAMALMGISQDLARYRGIGLAQAADMVGKAENGKLGVIVRTLPFLDTKMSKEEALAALQSRLGGQAQKFAATTAGAEERRKAAFEKMQAVIGEKLLPALAKLSDAGTRLINWFLDLPKPMQDGVLNLGLLATAFLLIVGPILLFVGQIATIGSALAGFGVSIGAVASTVGIVLAAIVSAFVWFGVPMKALVLAMVANVKQIRDNWDKDFGSVRAAFASVGKAIDQVAARFRKAWDLIVSVTKKGIDDAVKWLTALPGRAVAALKDLATRLSKPFVDAFNRISETVRTNVDNVVAFLVSLPGRIMDALKTLKDAITGPIALAREELDKLNPFRRRSPSLVDWVVAGTKAIKDAYTSIGDIEIKAPGIKAAWGQVYQAKDPWAAARAAAMAATRTVTMPFPTLGQSGGAMSSWDLGRGPRIADKPTPVHVFLDGREISRGLGSTVDRQQRTGER